MKNIKCGVYKITCLANGKIYIGSSLNINKRWKNHIWELNNNKHKNMFLQNAWNKYGEDQFKFEVLEETSLEDRFDIEQSYLDKLKPFYRTGIGFNISENSMYRNSYILRLFNPKNKENEGLYYIAKVKGCKPLLISSEDCDQMTRDEIIERCYAKQTYHELREFMIEADGYDDWEW